MSGPAKRTSPTRQQLWDLHAGVDRDGIERTWGEVAEHVGYSYAYVNRLAHDKKYPAKPVPVVLIDPREYESDLAHLSDEDVAKWQAQPYCLCGCALPTLQENSRSGRVPIGAFRMFQRAHWRRLPRYRDAWIARNRSPERNAAIWASVKKSRVHADDVNDLIWQWRGAEPGRNLDQLAKLAHLSKGHVQAIARREYVKPLTAAKLYVAMGEPLTRDLYREFKKWAGRKTLDMPKPIVQD